MERKRTSCIEKKERNKILELGKIVNEILVFDRFTMTLTAAIFPR